MAGWPYSHHHPHGQQRGEGCLQVRKSTDQPCQREVNFGGFFHRHLFEAGMCVSYGDRFRDPGTWNGVEQAGEVIHQSAKDIRRKLKSTGSARQLPVTAFMVTAGPGGEEWVYLTRSFARFAAEILHIGICRAWIQLVRKLQSRGIFMAAACGFPTSNCSPSRRQTLWRVAFQVVVMNAHRVNPRLHDGLRFTARARRTRL